MTDKFNSFFRGKRILVTGGTGSIGSEIVRQLIAFEPEQIRIYSRDESKHFAMQAELGDFEVRGQIRSLIGDVRDKERLDMAMQGIDIVFHTAALKHVPFCEYNPFEAIKTNVHGTQHVIDLAIKHNVARVIAISSDKAVIPNTVMGITKLLMERMVTSSHHYLGNATTKFSVVRFGNVLHSRGSVIPTWIEQIKAGKSITVTDKRMKRFFMSIPEAVKLVFFASAIMQGEEIFVLKMEEKNIYELAKEIILKHGNGHRVPIKITGIREKEKLTERLFTEQEQNHMLENDKFYIILPDQELLNQRKKMYQNFDSFSQFVPKKRAARSQLILSS